MSDLFEDPESDEYGPVFEARSYSRCGACDEKIHPDEPIRKDLVEGGYVHEGCADD